MFHVIHGYSSPDRYTNENGPVLELDRAETEEEVLALHGRYAGTEEEEGIMNWSDVSNVTFVVIEGGVERKVVEEQRVTEFKLA